MYVQTFGEFASQLRETKQWNRTSSLLQHCFYVYSILLNVPEYLESGVYHPLKGVWRARRCIQELAVLQLLTEALQRVQGLV